MPRTRLLIVAACLLGIPCRFAFADNAPTTRPAPGRYARQLGRECDDLLASAVRRPYGWGWESAVDPAKPPAKGAHSTVVSFEPGQSTAAGLLLLWASDQLHEPRYRDAAVQAARAVAAAQETTGKLPENPVFTTTPGGREPLSMIADRASTRAGMGLLLSVLDAQAPAPGQPVKKRDEELERAARRAAAWMLKQQPPTGAWPVGYPPATAPKDATRMVRLDTSDTRDSTFAMLLAYDVLGEPRYRQSVEHSVDSLLRFRLRESSRPGANLWSIAYNLNGYFNEDFREFPAMIDVSASRYCMQTLLGAYLSLGTPAAGDALNAAAKNLRSLPRQDSHWSRGYDLRYGYFHGPASQPTPDPFYRPPAHAADDPAAVVGTFGLLPLLAGVDALKDAGRLGYQESLETFFPYKQHLAAAINGLEDDPLAPDFPRHLEDLDAYLKSHEDDWSSLDSPPPLELAARVHRLWLLLIRVKLEQGVGR